MKRKISNFCIKFAAITSFTALSPLIAMAQDFQIDTNAIEAPAKGSAAKKSKDPAKTSDSAKTAGVHKAGGPDRQFGELEGWSPGKEPPKDPKDSSASSSQGGASGRGTRVTTTPSGNVGVGLGF